MKPLLLIFILFTISTGFTQETDTSPKLHSDTIYTDVIYPRFQKERISKCKITDITEGNLVHYIWQGKESIIEAKAAIKDGLMIDFTQIIYEKETFTFQDDSIKNTAKEPINKSLTQVHFVNTDVIIPTNSKDTIFNCEITEIRKNVVVFSYNGKQRKAIANSVVNKGQYISLQHYSDYEIIRPNDMNKDSLQNLTYMGHNYLYYYHKARSSKKLKTISLIATGGSIALLAISSYGIYNTDENDINSQYLLPAFGYAFLLGIQRATIATSLVGTGIFIFSSIDYKKHVQAMQNCTNRNYSLKFGMTNDGLGISLTF